MNESVFIGFILFVYKKFSYYYSKSLTHRLAAFLCGKIKSVFSGSSILRFVSKEEKTSDIWENSLIFKSLQKTLDWTLMFFRKLFGTISESCKSSRIIRPRIQSSKPGKSINITGTVKDCGIISVIIKAGKWLYTQDQRSG